MSTTSPSFETATESFALIPEHIVLLRGMNVRWESAMNGAPGIDTKRPYGNSDMLPDIARLLGIEGFVDAFDQVHYSKEQHALMMRLHRETDTALEVVLRTGSFQPGRYKSRPYRRDWTLTEPSGAAVPEPRFRERTVDLGTKYFALLPEHIALVRALYIEWDTSMNGAPVGNCKRPYGNSDLLPDLARLLQVEGFTDYQGEVHYSREQYEEMMRLHKETETALQVILSAMSFEPGYYQASKYGTDWKLSP